MTPTTMLNGEHNIDEWRQQHRRKKKQRRRRRNNNGIVPHIDMLPTIQWDVERKQLNYLFSSRRRRWAMGTYIYVLSIYRRITATHQLFYPVRSCSYGSSCRFCRCLFAWASFNFISRLVELSLISSIYQNRLESKWCVQFHKFCLL